MNQVLSDKEWEDVLNNTLPFGGNDNQIIYKEFGNIESREILGDIYKKGSHMLNHETNDSL